MLEPRGPAGYGKIKKNRVDLWLRRRKKRRSIEIMTRSPQASHVKTTNGNVPLQNSYLFTKFIYWFFNRIITIKHLPCMVINVIICQHCPIIYIFSYFVPSVYSQSKWTSSRSPCDVKTIVIEDCLSLGDALREIDRQVWKIIIIIIFVIRSILCTKKGLLLEFFSIKMTNCIEWLVQ